MNKQTMVVGIVVLLLLVGGVFVMSQQKSPAPVPTEVIEKENIAEPTRESTPESTLSASPAAMDVETGVKAFTIEGSPFKFSVPEMRVKLGDTVQVTFVNKEGFHDWVLEGYDVRTPQIAAGKSETIEFTADKTGTFEFYCSVGEHRKQGMEGKLIVE